MENLVLIDHPAEFKQGVRILMRTLRSKDGGKPDNPDRVAEKLVSRSPEEFEKIFEHLLRKREGQERIYSTIDARSLPKAIRKFKYDQLDADYFDKDSHESFYVDIYNRWISALQNSKSREGTLFLVDVDRAEESDYDGCIDMIHSDCHTLKIEIVHEYHTKNGMHIILKPFNPNLVNFDIKKNSMMLWAYER